MNFASLVGAPTATGTAETRVAPHPQWSATHRRHLLHDAKKPASQQRTMFASGPSRHLLQRNDLVAIGGKAEVVERGKPRKCAGKWFAA